MRCMKAPLFVRALTDEEQQQIQAGLRSSDAFVLRRCQIVLASARGERAIVIAHQLSCNDQTVRNVIKKWNTDGLGVLQAGSSRPPRLRTVMDERAIQQVPAILHRPPRDVGKEQSLWSLEALVQVCFEQELTGRVLTIEGMRKILRHPLETSEAPHQQPGCPIGGKKSP